MSAPGPAPPAPATTLKCACADLWAQPAVQLLAGPALRPGGRALTARLVERVGLGPGARVLDVVSGTGATLRELAGRGITAVGVDYSRVLAAQAADGSSVAVGDAEALPFAPGSFDAVLVECVLSALPDKPAALAEVRRVLGGGGAAVVTDVVVAGPLPEPLRTVAAWAACVGGALPAEGYEALLSDAGFTTWHREDASAALRALVDQAERRLAMLRGALAVGLLPDLGAGGPAPVPSPVLGPDPGLELGLALGLDVELPAGDLAALAALVFGQVRAAIDRRQLGYVALVSS